MIKSAKIASSSNKYVKEGKSYTYIDSTMSSVDHLTFLTQDVTGTSTPAAKTLNPIYKNTTKLSFMYNDETPTGRTSSSYGHTKGVIGADYSGGFWLIHSVPSYPPLPENSSSYGYPNTGLNYGQSFLCLSLSLTYFPSSLFHCIQASPSSIMSGSCNNTIIPRYITLSMTQRTKPLSMTSLI